MVNNSSADKYSDVKQEEDHHDVQEESPPKEYKDIKEGGMTLEDDVESMLSE